MSSSGTLSSQRPPVIDHVPSATDAALAATLDASADLYRALTEIELHLYNEGHQLPTAVSDRAAVARAAYRKALGLEPVA